MKGIFFRGNLEFRLEVDGERWRQGESLRGTLTVRNHGKEPLAAGSRIQVTLALGSEKKVKAKAEGAFKRIDSREFPASMAPGASSDALPWEFPLTLTTPVSDSMSSLYLVYGPEGAVAPPEAGALQLRIIPHQHLEDLIDVLSTTYRFPVKKILAADYKGGVEVKLDPPEGSKRYSTTDQLVATFHLLPGENGAPTSLDVEFDFHLREADATSGSIQYKKARKAVDRTIPVRELLHSFNQRVNREAFEKVVEGIFGEVYGNRLA